MRIGLYISPSHTVPPVERNILAPWMLVGDLANSLVSHGHDVTLFAAKGSKTNAKLVHGGIESTIKRRSEYNDVESYRAYVIAQELALMREVVVAAKMGKLDIVHIHQPVERLYPALLAMPAKVPVVITFHDPIRPERFPALEKLVGLGNVHFVALSESQKRGVPFPFAGVVPNGIDLKAFKQDSGTKDVHSRPLLITGRIVQEKGFIDAVEASRKAEKRLLIVGQEYTTKKIPRDYFQQQILPKIDGTHVFLESVVKQEHLIGHYQNALALLFPIHWEEPFGLVMIEAMACGTPVIAYNHGSVPEIVQDGVTGFIVDDVPTKNSTWVIQQTGIDGLVEAIRRVDSIDRNACRSHVEKHFRTETMRAAYETVYRSLHK